MGYFPVVKARSYTSASTLCFFRQERGFSKTLSSQEEENVIKRLPFIPMKEGWKVQLFPNFNGAFLRMYVQLPDGRKKSVYLDVDDALGAYGKDAYLRGNPGKKPVPYWEVFPSYTEAYPEEDNGRCALEDVDELVRLIES